MRLLQLYYFKALAENEHLLNTAKELHISPPALSTAISNLAEELGVELFSRVGRNIYLNENGRLFYQHVVRIFDEIDAAKKELKGLTAKAPEIKVGTSAMFVWNELFSAFMKRYPELPISHTNLLLNQMQAPDVLSRFDLIITDIHDITDCGWEHKIIAEDPPVFIVYEGHPFAERESVSMEEARDEAFIAVSKEYSSRRFFDQACEMAGFVPHIVAEVDCTLRFQLVYDHYGIAFSSYLSSRTPAANGLKVIPVEDFKSQRIQTIFWKKGGELPESVKIFRDFLLSYYEDFRRGGGRV